MRDFRDRYGNGKTQQHREYVERFLDLNDCHEALVRRGLEGRTAWDGSSATGVELRRSRGSWRAPVGEIHRMNERKRNQPQRRHPTHRQNVGARQHQNRSAMSAQRNYERYLALARDATLNGDIVEAENFHQHAEHYFRVMRERAVLTTPRHEEVAE